MVNVGNTDSAVGRVAGDIRTLAEQIAILVHGLRGKSAPLAEATVDEALQIIEASLDRSAPPSSTNVVSMHATPAEPVRKEASETVNDFILSMAREYQVPLSVQQIFDFLLESGHDIARPSLVVKLHRLVKGGHLVSPSTGHFRIPDNQQSSAGKPN